MRPRSTSAAPAKRSASKPKKAGLSCQSVMDHGTRPTIVPGAITKKNKEPRAAQNRLMRFLPRNLRATRRAGRCYIIEEHDIESSLLTKDGCGSMRDTGLASQECVPNEALCPSDSA